MGLTLVGQEKKERSLSEGRDRARLPLGFDNLKIVKKIRQKQ
jgi:hypothetical protein